MIKKYNPFEEFTNQYPEFGWMRTVLALNKVGFGKTKQQRAAVQRLGSSAAKLLTLSAAFTAAVVLSLSIRIHSTLESVGTTSADIRARVIAERDEDKEAVVYYRFERVEDGAVLETAFLPINDVVLSYDNLEPDTTYRLTYYVEANASTTDAGGDPIEVVGRFEFTTLMPGDTDGTGGGGGGGGRRDNPRKTDSGRPKDEPSATPTPVVTPEAKPTPTPPPELEIVTESLPDGQELLYYEQPLMVRYTGSSTLTFSIDGPLPAGLTFSDDGVLSGTPQSGAGGTWSGLRVTATDPVAGVTAEKTYSLVIGETKPLNITNRGLSNTKQTYRYKCQITVDWQDTSTLTFSAAGLPSGLRIDSGTGLISGKTTEETRNGAYNVTVTAKDTLTPAETSRTFELYVGLMPTPVPEDPLVDLAITEFIAADGPDTVSYTIQVNDAEVSGITLDGDISMPLPSPGFEGAWNDGRNLELGAATHTLNVSYTLDGASRSKSATISITYYPSVTVALRASAPGETGFFGEIIVDITNSGTTAASVTGVTVSPDVGTAGALTCSPGTTSLTFSGNFADGSYTCTVGFKKSEVQDSAGTHVDTGSVNVTTALSLSP